jgi:hypothetical protein
MRHTMKLRGILLAVAAAMLTGVGARADVETILSRNETGIGQPVLLVYRFTNTEQPEDMPEPSIMVDGLQVRFRGANQQNNFSFSFGAGGGQNRSESVIEYNYAVTPLRPGDFTIPGFQVRVGAQTLRTKPARLKVFGVGGSLPPAQVAPQVPPGILPQPVQPLPVPGGQTPAAPAGREGEPYFAELLMTAKPVYVGEVVPVDLRFYFRGDIPLREIQRVAFAGDGFTAVPLGEPTQGEQMIGNVGYRVLTFRSAITALKTGDIDIPAVTMGGTVMVSAAPPGIDAFFDQFFGNFPMPGMGRAEPVEVSTPGRTLKVLPLPKEGRPAGFNGAVGQFTLDASVDPASAGPGEPVTLSLAVSGRGNFDAISPPALTGEESWRTYAPKERFEKDDAVGSAGTKTFDFKIVARSNQTQTPGAEFSYFDPRKKEYVTLKAEPQHVDAAGRSAATSDDQTLPPVATGAAPGPQPAQTPAEDIASPAPSLSSSAGQGFVPSLNAPWFRWLNAAFLAFALMFLPLLFWLRRRRIKSARTAELESVLREAKSALHKASEKTEFYNAAANFVQARLDLLNGKAGTFADAAAALEQRAADPLERRELQSVLARRDELKYGGGTGGALPDDERRRIVSVLEKFAAQKP